MEAVGEVLRPDWRVLVERAVRLAAAGERAILGITGKPGAGKTSLALGLVEGLRSRAEIAGGSTSVAHVPMDGFHLADVELDRLGLRDRKGAPETFDDAGYAALLQRLRARVDAVVYAPAFERGLEEPIAGSIAVPRETRLVITEGNYLLHPDGAWPRARAQLDEVWYCDLDDEVRIKRLVERHVAFGKSRAAAEAWVHRSDEANARLIADTRSAADGIVDLGALGRP
jgi:pantothenate kinase